MTNGNNKPLPVRASPLDPPAEVYDYLGLVGFSLYLTWMIVGYYTNLNDFAESSLSDCAMVRSFSFLTMGIVLGCASKLNGPVKRASLFALCILAFVLQLPLGILSFIFLGGHSVNFVIIVFSWMFFGASAACSILAWGLFYGRSRVEVSERFIAYCGGSAAIGTTILLSLIEPVQTVVFFSLPAFSAGCLVAGLNQMGGFTNQPAPRPKKTYALPRFGSLYLTCIAVALGFAASLLVMDTVPHISPYATPAVLALAFIISAIVVHYYPQIMIMGNTLRILLPFIIAGMLMLLVLPDVLRLICLILVVSTLIIVDLYNWIALSTTVKLFSLPPYARFGEGRIPFALGQGFGWFIGMFLYNTAFVNAPIMLWCTIVVVIALSFCLAFPVRYAPYRTSRLDSAAVTSPTESSTVDLVPETNAPPAPQNDIESSYEPKETTGDDASSKSIGRWQRNIDAIAQYYGLSPRENEVLALLCKGRNARHIGETLFISDRTAKSHIYHIYRKMCVESRQELIDLVEKGSTTER